MHICLRLVYIFNFVNWLCSCDSANKIFCGFKLYADFVVQNVDWWVVSSRRWMVALSTPTDLWALLWFRNCEAAWNSWFYGDDSDELIDWRFHHVLLFPWGSPAIWWMPLFMGITKSMSWEYLGIVVWASPLASMEIMGSHVCFGFPVQAAATTPKEGSLHFGWCLSATLHEFWGTHRIYQARAVLICNNCGLSL